MFTSQNKHKWLQPLGLLRNVHPDCIQSLQAYYQGFDKHARSNYSDSAGSGCQWHRMGPKFGQILARQPWEKWGIHRLLAM